MEAAVWSVKWQVARSPGPSPAGKLERVVCLLGLCGGGGDGADDGDARAVACRRERAGTGRGLVGARAGAHGMHGIIVASVVAGAQRRAGKRPKGAARGDAARRMRLQGRLAHTCERALQQPGELGVAEGDVRSLALAAGGAGGARRWGGTLTQAGGPAHLLSQACCQPLSPTHHHHHHRHHPTWHNRPHITAICTLSPCTSNAHPALLLGPAAARSPTQAPR